ncbi:Uu.00g052820.m01.CDS01 [Anthostomella pinea]|uniref:Uu.00g052820.m01.CDS01 n=1 Tax=Anthostomella pinea TaxID=933095 RepID=A0AAI8VWC4_9PEZI|nr:Uu.00g052820.m01.CDS01 [Anthostomella pinea]
MRLSAQLSLLALALSQALANPMNANAPNNIAKRDSADDCKKACTGTLALVPSPADGFDVDTCSKECEGSLHLKKIAKVLAPNINDDGEEVTFEDGWKLPVKTFYNKVRTVQKETQSNDQG